MAVEIGCVLVIAAYLALRRRAVAEAAWQRRALLIVAASWLAEDSCIRLYSFYAYYVDVPYVDVPYVDVPYADVPRGVVPGHTWSLPIDRVPLLIALIWPLVVLSAQALARRLVRGAEPSRLALVTGLLVVADAAFIEPVAVRAGLWHWTEPGIFGVPLIGILGWGLFAAAATYLLERLPGPAQLLVIVAAPAATHAALLASWWGALRWLPRPLPDGAATACALGAGALATFWVVRALRQREVEARELLARLVAAAFFFVLLVIHGRGSAMLVAYCLAFAPPYLVLLGGVLRRRAAAQTATPGSLSNIQRW